MQASDKRGLRTRTDAALSGLCLTLAMLGLSLMVGLAAPARAAPAVDGPEAVAATIDGAHLAVPLVRTAPTSAPEDLALAGAVAAYERAPGDTGALTAFLARYPRSGWASSLHAGLGYAYLHDGYFSRTIDAWRQSWALGKDATDPHARAIVDETVGELARLYASFGQYDNLSALFKEMGGRQVTGLATQMIQLAGEDLTLVKKAPDHLFNCGPVALAMLMAARDAQDRRGDFLAGYRAGPNGTSLAELGGLADKAGLPYRLISRTPGQPVPAMAVVHWKVGHYGAIIGEANGRYHIADGAFPLTGLWVTPAALDAESSGYFLVAANDRKTDGGKPGPWRPVATAEAAKVWGRGSTVEVVPGDPHDPIAASGAPNCGLCGYGIKESTVGLTISDIPVGYSPPIGPSAKVQITYNQREDCLPAPFTCPALPYGVSPNWTLNWLSYVTDDPSTVGTAGAAAFRHLPGGGFYTYSGYTGGATSGQFLAQDDDGSILVLTNTNPITYNRLLRDGGSEVYSLSPPVMGSQRNIFLSQVIDPQGNRLTLNYDSQYRLISLTDAVGRSTTFAYNQSQSGCGTSTPSTLLVTQITDPFSRSATLCYDSMGRLISITDVLGLTSSFTYDGYSLVNAMTTPYGTTGFAYTPPCTQPPCQPRYLQITDPLPLGFNEREEWVEPPPSIPIPPADPWNTVPHNSMLKIKNSYLEYRDSFYWNKDAYVAANCTNAPPPNGGCDYTMARDTHFLHFPIPPMSGIMGIKSTTIESIKNPLENRIWFNYSGQQDPHQVGAFDQPTATARVLDDGSTQISQAAYDSANYFLPTSITDPSGRATSYVYDSANHVDLLTVSQTINGTVTPIDTFGGYALHEPATYTDAAGKTTTFTYTSPAGQLQSVTDPLGHITRYNYDAFHRLKQVIDANNVPVSSYIYNTASGSNLFLVQTFTDSSAPDPNTGAVWAVTYAYDKLDRITSVTYPDGTEDLYNYNILDLAGYTDRLGRTWTYKHDADRRLYEVDDPTGQATKFGYNNQGQITSRTDPQGNMTAWMYDIEGRLKAKTYADNSALAVTYESTTSRTHSVKDALNQTETFAYYPDNRIQSMTWSGLVTPNSTPNVGFVYDANFPRLVSRTDTLGSVSQTTSYRYVPVGSQGALQLLGETQPLASIAYGYDELGRLTSRTVGGNGAETFAYDTLGRLASHAGDLGAFTLGYNGESGQIALRAGTNLSTAWAYQPNAMDRRLQSLTTTWRATSPNSITKFAYASNAENQILRVAQTSDAPIALPPGAFTQTAAYPDTLNQLTALTTNGGTPATLSWDADGNLASDATRAYAWDGANRLAAITYPAFPGEKTSFAYDGLGRRTAITQTPPTGGGHPVTTSYVWCGAELCQARNATGQVSRAYYAEGEFAPGSPAKSYYYAPDNLGSVRRVFAKNQSPTYDYDPYGAASQATAPLTDFTWAGMFHEPQSGLYLTANRPYDPATGRFQSRDPAGEGADPEGNLYPYVGGDPINLTDPLGLCPVPSSGSGLAGAIGVFLAGAAAIAVEEVVTAGAATVAVPAEVAALAALTTGADAATAATADAGAALIAEDAGGALSEIRLTQEGESFFRYESGNPAFSRVTSSGGLQPGTFAAPADEGVRSQSLLNGLYKLPSPEIPRATFFEINPPAGTPVIGPRPVVGGGGSEVVFPFGAGPESAGPELPTPR